MQFISSVLKKHQTLIVLALILVAVVAAFTGHPLGALGSGGLIIGMAGQEASSDVIRVLVAWGVCDVAGGVKKRLPQAKTANYAIVSPATSAGDPSGTIFTNRGAVGAVTFTLPAVIPALQGVWYDFVGFANQTFTVAAAAGTVCTFNNAAATSVACSTAGAKIGAHIQAYCDGTSWHVNGDTVGVTYTVA